VTHLYDESNNFRKISATEHKSEINISDSQGPPRDAGGIESPSGLPGQPPQASNSGEATLRSGEILTLQNAAQIVPEEKPESEETLAAVLAKYKLELASEQISLLDHYRRLVGEWNEKINLTRHTDLEKFVTRDVLDTLALAELLEKEELVLDVGTGAGVPGVILAILRPDLRVVLCDSVTKKARAVQQIVSELGLQIPVAAARVQDLLGPATQFNTLVGRAIGAIRDVLKWLRPHWKYFDRLLLIKGRSWVRERGQARHHGMMHHLALRKLKEYHNPANGAYNVILQICPEERIVSGRKCRLRELRSHRPKLPEPPVPPLPVTSPPS
jgi:16S rRNA (guanine527-N7)-methyltransferase